MTSRWLTSDGAEELRAVNISNIDKAQSIITNLAGGGVNDDLLDEFFPLLLNALKESPDPDRALLNFSRWSEAVTSRFTQYNYLLSHPTALNILLSICGVSQFFADLIVRSPEYLELLSNPEVRSGSRTAAGVYNELSQSVDSIQSSDLRLEAIRRFKQRELLRIGVRDILNLSDMPTTAYEFTNLTDACVQKCYEIAVASYFQQVGLVPSEHALPFVVIGMGKLGGQELNYSSDIDLFFVCGDSVGQHDAAFNALEAGTKIAERLVKYLTDQTGHGRLYRVDMRLRPEGRFGALVRTLSSYRQYYESWAEPWERQSLIKARPVAGDPVVGEQFMRILEPYVYRTHITTDFIRSIRENKERIEQKAILEQQGRSNVKIGIGGIRDIEFTAQILQLTYGGELPRLRTQNTLKALSRLKRAKIIDPQAAAQLVEDYKFLRTVEHRLQLLYDAQTQTIPSGEVERSFLARRLGYQDVGEFDADYLFRTNRVHSHFQRYFLAAGVDEKSSNQNIWKNLVSQIDVLTTRGAISYALEAEGFVRPNTAIERMSRAVHGNEYGEISPEVRNAYGDVLGALINACAMSLHPDDSFTGLDDLIQSQPNPAAICKMLQDDSDLLMRIAMLAGYWPEGIKTLTKHFEWLDFITSEELTLQEGRSKETILNELDVRMRGSKDIDDSLSRLSNFMLRERLWNVSREIWLDLQADQASQELFVVASSILETLLGMANAALHESNATINIIEHIAIIGLGKLGGAELSYDSDWDTLIVYEVPSESLKPQIFAAASKIAEFILGAGPKLRSRGVAVDIDARLRPEGRVGALTYTVDEFRDYYTTSALTWEKQALVRARYVAGNEALGTEYLEMVHSVIYATPLPDVQLQEIRDMKRRMETERLKPEHVEEDLKLGQGGMSDIEFLVQMRQLQYGWRYPELRRPQTVTTLRTLGSLNLLPPLIATRLAEAYLHFMKLRLQMALGKGSAFVSDDDLETCNLMKEVRTIIMREFYGQKY